jgi:bifunctional DNase/RNase
VIGEPNCVHLREVGGRRWLSFYTGFIEAALMWSSLAVPSPTRPLTHDVMAGIVRVFRGLIQYVLIEDFVSEGQFYRAKLVIAGADASAAVDARPSDAISLAVRTGSDIFVSERLLAGS